MSGRRVERRRHTGRDLGRRLKRVQRAAARDVAGRLPEQHAERVLRLDDGAFKRGNLPCHGQLQLLGLAHVERGGHSPDAAQVGEPVAVGGDVAGAMRDFELRVERAQSEVGRGDVSNQRGQYCPGALGSEELRPSASFMRRSRPHTSTSQVAPTSARTDSISRAHWRQAPQSRSSDRRFDTPPSDASTVGTRLTGRSADARASG